MVNCKDCQHSLVRFLGFVGSEEWYCTNPRFTWLDEYTGEIVPIEVCGEGYCYWAEKKTPTRR